MSILKYLFGQAFEQPEPPSPPPEPPKPPQKSMPGVRETVRKIAAAIKDGTWETKWEQRKSYNFYGHISFEAKPRGQKEYYPSASCLWHPENNYYSGNIDGICHEDMWNVPKTCIDLTDAEKKLIQETFISLLPEEYQKAPVEVLEEQRLKELENYV